MQKSVHWTEIRVTTSGVSLGVVGDPIEHSLSPRMHEAALAACGIEGRYLAIRVAESEFEDAIAHLAACGFLGLNVTLPHKAAAADIATTDDPIVRDIHVANCLLLVDEVRCRNFDVPGFLAPIADLSPNTALVLGAGGAAAAAAYGLLRAGWRVVIWNRSERTGKSLCAALAPFGEAEFREEPNPEGCDLVVNATPLGLKEGDCPPLVWEALHPRATLYDLAYRAEPTDLLREAACRGLATVDGREMLVEQGALAFEWWFDRRAPRDVMRRAVGLE